MQAKECRAAFKRLFPSRAAAAAFLGYNERTVRRWQSGELPVPIPVSKLTAIMIRERYTPDEINHYWMREMGL